MWAVPATIVCAPVSGGQAIYAKLKGALALVKSLLNITESDVSSLPENTYTARLERKIVAKLVGSRPNIHTVTGETKTEFNNICDNIMTRSSIRSLVALAKAVGVAGTVNSGKSALLHRAWGFKTSPSMVRHTDVVGIYSSLDLDLIGVDFPGRDTALKSIRAMLKEDVGLVGCFVVLASCSAGGIRQADVECLVEIAQYSQVDVLFCFNRVDEVFFQSVPQFPPTAQGMANPAVAVNSRCSCFVKQQAE